MFTFIRRGAVLKAKRFFKSYAFETAPLLQSVLTKRRKNNIIYSND